MCNLPRPQGIMGNWNLHFIASRITIENINWYCHLRLKYIGKSSKDQFPDYFDFWPCVTQMGGVIVLLICNNSHKSVEGQGMIKFFCHIIGKLNIKLHTLHRCPAKWLDRDLDGKRVEDISWSVAPNPAIIHNGEPWLAMANVTKEDVTNDKSIIKRSETGTRWRPSLLCHGKEGTKYSFTSQRFWVTKCFSLLLGQWQGKQWKIANSTTKMFLKDKKKILRTRRRAMKY